MKTKRQLKILTFDIENRPLSYWYDGRPTAEITAIASCWNNDMNTMEVGLLGRDEPQKILSDFLARYNQADIVVGHFIRSHDLPIINGALMEFGFPNLTPKLVQDTKLDMYKKGDIPATQEFLSALFKLPFPKIHMTQVDWREGNRLTPQGLEGTQERVVGDVLQNISLRNYMLDRQLLKYPRIWKP